LWQRFNYRLQQVNHCPGVVEAPEGEATVDSGGREVAVSRSPDCHGMLIPFATMPAQQFLCLIECMVLRGSYTAAPLLLFW
jgi:hypothetical protein